MSKGKEETSRLRENVEQQLNRLLQQLQDLEELKDDLSPEEIVEQRDETIKQMSEFKESLARMMSGNAIQATISQAFKTPEVIRLFARKQPSALRARLDDIRRELQLGHMTRDTFNVQTTEVLVALKQLQEPLRPEEEAFLREHGSDSMAQFTQASAAIGGAVLATAGAGIRKARQQ